VRYTFTTGGHPALGRATVLIGLPLFVILAVALFRSGHPVWATIAALVALGFLIGVAGIRRRFAVIELVIDGSGLHVASRRGTLDLAWDQVGAWGFGDLFLGRPTLSEFPCLLVFPAAGVDPARVGGRWMWVERAGCWRVAKARRLVGDVTLVQAIETFVQGRRRDATKTILGTTPKPLKARPRMRR
jgi:hypothetical protein